MRRERFTRLVAEALDSLPARFRKRMRNVVVLVEDVPPEQARRRRRKQPVPRSLQPGTLVLGHFIGTAMTEKSVFALPAGPDRIVLYQKNIEAVCAGARQVREQVRLTVIHELGHYFGMSEDQLKDV